MFIQNKFKVVGEIIYLLEELVGVNASIFYSFPWISENFKHFEQK